MAYKFHSGELDLQTRMGVRETADRVGKSTYSFVPEAAGLFLEERRLVVLGAADNQSRPWASLLTGPAGFVQRIDEHTIRIEAVPAPGDPMATNLVEGSLAGILVPDLSTRRRLRINGRLEPVDGAILLHVDQAYSNCPKYIQLRVTDRESTATHPRLVRRSAALLPSQREWIRRADTFFIATLVPGEGADASHRGGMPGFIRIENQELVWPDYPGNAMFNTLGNIVRYPRAGILIPDFETGSSLQLTGRATIDSNPGQSPSESGQKLRVRFAPDEVVQMEHVLPERLRLIEYSPFNPR
jgi:predicted pyridoxine 5'-phosphate oxidase superfamily flavin-nucleotide-binding protein